MNKHLSTIIDALYEYECTEDCAGQPSWEKLVKAISEELK